MKIVLLTLLCCLTAQTGFALEVVEQVQNWNEYLERLKELQIPNEDEPQNKESRKTTRERFFEVDFETPPVKKTIHTLTPHDIDSLGALGDSLTAGTGAGAWTLPGIAIQFRGISWLAGGDNTLESSLTLTTILRKFNPDIKGYSVGNGIGYASREEDWFNAAVPGGRAHDMLDQATNLVNIMKNDSRTSFDNDWKLISIFIGGNDLCAIGGDPSGTTPEAYVAEIKKALDYFHAELPRTIVQVIQIMEIYLLKQVPYGENTPPFCNLTQRLFCGYVVQDRNEAELRAINEAYQVQLAALINSGDYDTRDDFTVVLQPFFQDTVLPVTENGKVDASYFAPDCFHFSSKGHALGALNVWNNMLEPVGEKSTEWGINDLKCPTQNNPYIFTLSNSQTTKYERNRRDVIEERAESPCVYEECNKIPGWATGTTIGLGAAVAAEAIFMMILQRGKKCL